MPYSSVWMSAPVATVASMIGWIVLCCTLATMCRTTGPRRWIRPRMGACPSPACPGLARRPACDGARTAPFGHGRGLALVPGHHVNLVNLHLTLQPGCWGFGHEATAQMLRHGLHVRGVQAEFRRDLPVREVQAHEGEAQHPHPQRLRMPGQRRAGEVVKAPGAVLAPIALPVRLGVVAPVADHRVTATSGTAHALGPAKLAHQCEAFRVVQQPREVDQVRCRHEHQGSLREGGSRSAAPIIRSEVPRDGYPLPCPSTPRKPTRAWWVWLFQYGAGFQSCRSRRHSTARSVTARHASVDCSWTR